MRFPCTIDSMDPREKQVGETVRALRGDVSQAMLADQMATAGHEKWSQSTVWAVEQGKRPLRLTEAQSLAVILGREVTDFVSSASARQVAEASDRLVMKALNLAVGEREYVDARIALEECVDEVGDDAFRWISEDAERFRHLSASDVVKLAEKPGCGVLLEDPDRPGARG